MIMFYPHSMLIFLAKLTGKPVMMFGEILVDSKK